MANQPRDVRQRHRRRRGPPDDVGLRHVPGRARWSPSWSRRSSTTPPVPPGHGSAPRSGRGVRLPGARGTDRRGPARPARRPDRDGRRHDRRCRAPLARRARRGRRDDAERPVGARRRTGQGVRQRCADARDPADRDPPDRARHHRCPRSGRGLRLDGDAALGCTPRAATRRAPTRRRDIGSR